MPFTVKKELNCDNLFENYGSETGFGLDGYHSDHSSLEDRILNNVRWFDPTDEEDSTANEEYDYLDDNAYLDRLGRSHAGLGAGREIWRIG